MKTTTETRSIEVELPIRAPAEAVWKALTDADELRRWFPLDARTEPGEGGTIAVAWGAAHQGVHRIKAWETQRHLQMTWFEPTEMFGERPDPLQDAVASVFEKDPEGAARLLVDYFLESRGGTTVLRLVHSGFSQDAQWDDDFDAHQRGWNFELRSLRNYLEHHLGKTRHIAWVLQPVRVDLQEAWDRILGAEGLVREGGLAGNGERYGLTTVHGDRLEGQVFNNQPPWEFAGTVENLDHSLLRCGVETWTSRPEAQFWLSTWGDAARAETFRNRWTETLQALFT